MSDLPLLTWQKHAEHYRLMTDRESLLARIRALKPHAHKRLALEERVRQITLRQMELEIQLDGQSNRRRHV